MSDLAQPQAAATWPATYRGVIADVIDSGSLVDAGDSLSIGASRSSLELLNHSFAVADPTNRIVHGKTPRFNLAAALGRFVWMMTGSNRLDEIAFYDRRAERFSDDGHSVPGSSDGARLLNPRPGLNQIDRVINVLRSEAGTRRGVAVVYHPEDAGRVSRDVPCHIAVAYNVRGGALHASTVMRSCNAARVLPYDFFLFTLLAETVAGAAGYPLGSYHQFSVSMHVYTDDEPYARGIVDTAPMTGIEAMPGMPSGDVMGDIRALAEIERDVRHRIPYADIDEIRLFSKSLTERIDPYWSSFAQVLLLHAAKAGDAHPQEIEQLSAGMRERVFPAFRPFI